MIRPTQISTALKAALPLLFTFWVFYWMGGPAPGYHEVLRQFKGDRGKFVSDMLSNEVGGPFDGKPIQDLCASKKWTPGLIVSCDPARGGFGHVRNAHLTCIRLAIEAGAELILPPISRRSEDDITQLTPMKDPKGPLRGEHLRYLFDEPHLVGSLRTHCPQMRLYSSMDELADQPSVLVPHNYDPNTFPGESSEGGTYAEPKLWAERFAAWLEEVSPHETRRYPLRVRVPALNYYWPVGSDGAEFARQFGRILRPHENARRLAAAALHTMSRRFGWAWQPRRQQVLKDSFVGVHLRTERDAEGRFPPYPEQGAEYLNYAANSNLTVAFVAHGQTATDVDQFVLRARDFGIEVVTKRDLLEARDVAFLDRMTFDQQGMVDFEILTRAALHTGPSESAFSWNVALRRSTMGADYGFEGIEDLEAAAKGQDGTPDASEGKVRWVDEFGILYGVDSFETQAMAQGIWP